jgi:uncharacterized membrane protein YGL010W
LFGKPFVSTSIVKKNVGFIVAVFYALFYAALDIKAGSFVAVFIFLGWVSSSFVANSLGYELAWKVLC